MRLDSRVMPLARAVADIPDGATVMVGGFGVPGTPFALIQALVDHGARDLTVIKNDANNPAWASICCCVRARSRGW